MPALKALWNQLVPLWDDRTFYDFVATSKAFAGLSFQHREVFGQVGFGTGGWDSDFPNSMLEILRVVMTNCDDEQRLIVGGADQVPLGLWQQVPDTLTHWPAGTTLASLHGGAPRAGVAGIQRQSDGNIAVTDRWGDTRSYAAVLTTCQSWLLTTQIACDESLFSQKMWMALDRTRYMQSSKTFVMVDRPRQVPVFIHTPHGGHNPGAAIFRSGGSACGNNIREGGIHLHAYGVVTLALCSFDLAQLLAQGMWRRKLVAGQYHARIRAPP